MALRGIINILAGKVTIPESSWQIGLVRSPMEEVLAHWPPTPESVVWIEGPATGYWADPFLVEGPDGALWVFCEEYFNATDRGTEIALKIDPANGKVLEKKSVCELPFHLSYPNVFQHGGRWYALPEQYQKNCVQLYEITDFPGSWNPSTVLIPDFAGIDPTLYFDGGTWWLFVNRYPDDARILHLYYADDLHGPWTAHPESPWSAADAGQRMAGRVWKAGDGQVYRLSQDDLNNYGDALWLNRIDQLDREHFREVRERRLPPHPGWPMTEGCHHLSTAGGWTSLDARGIVPRRPTLPERWDQIRRRLSEISGKRHG